MDGVHKTQKGEENSLRMSFLSVPDCRRPLGSSSLALRV